MVAPIRVLLLSEPAAETGNARFPRVLSDVLSELIGSQDDMELIESVGGEDDLREVLSHDGADVIVMSCPPGGLTDQGARLLRRRPPVRIVSVAPDGRSTVLHELTPVSRTMGDVSPAEVLDAIRNGFDTPAEVTPNVRDFEGAG